MDSLLDAPEFDALDAIEQQRVEAALADPQARDKLLLSAVLALRKEQRGARSRCETVCLPKIQERLRRLERFMIGLIGIGSGLTIASGIGYGIFELVKFVKGG